LGRYIYGNRANEHMNVDELNALERYLEIWMYNTRSAKVIHHPNASLKKKMVSGFAKTVPCLPDADNGSRDPSTEKQGMSKPCTY
jgi:hypothetical protein